MGTYMGLLFEEGMTLEEVSQFLEKIRINLNYNPETGLFCWLRTGPGRLIGSNAGTDASNGRGKVYRKIRFEKRFFYSHRLAWLIVCGRWPVGDVDHINGNGRDNRWINLRETSRVDNQHNMKLHRNNTTGCPGVSFHRQSGLWHAVITCVGRTHSLRYHKTKEEAIAVRKQAEVDLGFHPNHGSVRPG